MRDEKFSKQPPDEPRQAYINNSGCRYVREAYSHFRQGDAQTAIEKFNQAIEVNPDSPELYYKRGNFRRKNISDQLGAIEDYTQAISLQPENALFYLWRSQVYNELGQQSQAIVDYNTAIRLSPENTIIDIQSNFE